MNGINLPLRQRLLRRSCQCRCGTEWLTAELSGSHRARLVAAVLQAAPQPVGTQGPAPASMISLTPPIYPTLLAPKQSSLWEVPPAAHLAAAPSVALPKPTAPVIRPPPIEAPDVAAPHHVARGCVQSPQDHAGDDMGDHRTTRGLLVQQSHPSLLKLLGVERRAQALSPAISPFLSRRLPLRLGRKASDAGRSRQ